MCYRLLKRTPGNCEILDIGAKLILHPNLLKYPKHFCLLYSRGDIVVLRVKFQNDWAKNTDIMDECDFGRFKYVVSSERILCYIAQHPRPLYFKDSIFYPNKEMCI